ncbi:MAG TPA: cytochrome C oxidase subunit IV family protein [Anaerolineae bacterium]|nr:cytochrome C oxidase subunit IV family protein [Anaerolineae bacterium]
METTKHAKTSTYVAVFVALAIVTGVEIFLGQNLPGAAKLIVLLALALVKALLVALIFMHLRYDSKIYRWFLIFPIFMALLLIVIVIIQYMTFPIG